jgi:dihydrofolate reductase
MARRTITYGGAISLDGFLAGVDGSIDWLHFSKDVDEVMADYWKDVDTILMGRKTYLVAMGQSTRRPRPKRAPRARKTTQPRIRSYVFSRTLTQVDDPRVEVIASDAATFVRDLKSQPGKNICLMGGGELAQSLIAADLVDTIGLNIHPILLGSGVPVFRDPSDRVRLRLTECRPMDGGCVFARYDVVHRTTGSTT